MPAETTDFQNTSSRDPSSTDHWLQRNQMYSGSGCTCCSRCVIPPKYVNTWLGSTENPVGLDLIDSESFVQHVYKSKGRLSNSILYDDLQMDDLQYFILHQGNLPLGIDRTFKCLRVIWWPPVSVIITVQYPRMSDSVRSGPTWSDPVQSGPIWCFLNVF